MEVFTVGAAVVRAMVRGLQALGVDVAAVATETDFDLAALDDPETRVPEITVLTLWLAAEARWASGLLGLHAGRQTPPGAFDVLDYLAASAPTPGAALQRLAEYSAIANTGMGYLIEDQGAGDGEGQGQGTLVRFAMQHPYALDLLPPSFIEYLWALIVTRMRDKLAPAFAATLALRHAPQGPLALYREVFGQVVFEAPRAELRFTRDAWNAPNPREDAALSTLLERHARTLLAQLPTGSDPLDPVRTAITRGLRAGDASLERVASRLGVTPRTLQRQLAAAGTAYKDLLEGVRAELARVYLASKALSLTEISYLLGYSEPSAFNRAFRRREGETPLEFRRRTAPDLQRSRNEAK